MPDPTIPKHHRGKPANVPLAAALTVAAALLTATPAQAQPPRISPVAICAAIAQWPTIGGVVGVVLDLADQAGMSDEQAGRVVAHAILGTCPQYSSLLQRIVDRRKRQVA